MNLATVILAAGLGKRMRSKLPKVLQPVAGQPMVMYSINLAMQLSTQAPVLVIGLGAKLVRDRVGDCVRYVLQEQQLGTGHAVLQARDELRGRSEAVLVLYGDMPLLTPPTLVRLLDTFATTQPAIALLTVEQAGADSMGFGRVIRDEQGRVTAIVEEAVATPVELAIRELNCGIYCFRADWLWDNLIHLQVSGKGEYYLTDLVAMAAQQGERVEAVAVEDRDDVLGINDRLQLARATAIMRRRVNDELMRGGVTLVDPATTYVDAGVRVAPDTVIFPNTYLLGETSVGDDCIIGPNTLLRNATVAPGCRIEASLVEDSVLGPGVVVGPYSHVRFGTRLDEGVRVGAHGEVANAYLGPGTQVHHASYVIEATVGAGVSIGAGAVTCDGAGERAQTMLIEDGATIGAGAMLVAPLQVGAQAVVGAGSVVTHDVPANTVVYGVPARVRRVRQPELPAQRVGAPGEGE